MISWPYIHLLVNHFPVVLTAVGLVAALGGLALHRRGLWLYAMGTLTVAGIIVYPVHLTGDQAEGALHGSWYIRPGAIDAHDSVAGIATVMIILSGLVCAYALWRTLRRPTEGSFRFGFAPPYLSPLWPALGRWRIPHIWVAKSYTKHLY